MNWFRNWMNRRLWKRMTDTGPVRGQVVCNECGWEDTFWCEGKYAAAAEAEKRTRAHIMFAHPGDEWDGMNVIPIRSN